MILIIILPVFSQLGIGQYAQQGNTLIFEKIEGEYPGINKYNIDNTIYKEGNTYTFDYYYKDIEGETFYFEKEQVSKKIEDSFNWKFVRKNSQSAATIIKIVLTVTKEANLSKSTDRDYKQTVIRYELKEFGKEDCVSLEKTGIVENSSNVWLHPPRSLLFRILELNPFPYIKSPYVIGNNWVWSLEIADIWSDSRWKKWKGTITNRYEYRIIDQKDIKTNIGMLNCYVI